MLKEAAIPFIASRDFILSRRVSAGDDTSCSAHMMLCLTTTRLDAGVQMSKVVESGTLGLWSQMRYIINGYDDFLDASQDLPTRSAFKNFELGGVHIGQRISNVVKTLNKVAPSREKRFELVSTLGDLRREQYRINLSLRNAVQASDHLEIQKLKLHSSGALMRDFGRFFGLGVGLEQNQINQLSDALYYYGRAGQIVDDLADIGRDGDNPENLWVNMANQQGEKRQLLDGGFTIREINRCRRTRQSMESLFNEEVDSISPEYAFTRFSLQFFMKMVRIYSAFETKTELTNQVTS